MYISYTIDAEIFAAQCYTKVPIDAKVNVHEDNNNNNFSLNEKRKTESEKLRWKKFASWCADLSGSCGDARTHAKNLPRARARARASVARFHCNPSCRRRGPICRGVPLQISMQL